jgi:hypothetical protein
MRESQMNHESARYLAVSDATSPRGIPVSRCPLRDIICDKPRTGKMCETPGTGSVEEKRETVLFLRE